MALFTCFLNLARLFYRILIMHWWNKNYNTRIKITVNSWLDKKRYTARLYQHYPKERVWGITTSWIFPAFGQVSVFTELLPWVPTGTNSPQTPAYSSVLLKVSSSAAFQECNPGSAPVRAQVVWFSCIRFGGEKSTAVLKQGAVDHKLIQHSWKTAGFLGPTTGFFFNFSCRLICPLKHQHAFLIPRKKAGC